jgi:hypothetical protein
VPAMEATINNSAMLTLCINPFTAASGNMTVVRLTDVPRSLMWKLVHSIAIPLPKSGHWSVAAYNVDKPSTQLNRLDCPMTGTAS